MPVEQQQRRERRQAVRVPPEGAWAAPFTEAGIRDYLVLLSIYQTLRYRGLSFWKFLLSGETDIEAFTARSR